MKMRLKNSVLSGVVAFLFVAAPAMVASVATAKIGIINMQKIILNVDEGKQARASLEKEIKSKEAEFLKDKEVLDKLNQEWQNQSALLSEEARLKKQKEFQEKFLKLRNAEMEFQNEIKQKEQRATQGIAVKAAALVKDLAPKKKLQAVFEANSAGLVWVDKPVDLTDEVIALYAKDTAGKKVSKK